MKVNLATWGRFHFFDLARELSKRDVLGRLYTTYPGFVAARFGVPRSAVWTASHLELMSRLGSKLDGATVTALQHRLIGTWDRRVAKHLRPSDVFVGLSGFCVEGLRAAKRGGAIAILERGSAHIRMQAQLLSDEKQLTGYPVAQVSQYDINREEEGYALADYVVVLSTFCFRSFVSQGFSPTRLLLSPLGVDPLAFCPRPGVGPRRLGERLVVINTGAFSFQKGIHYLMASAKMLDPARFRFLQVGPVADMDERVCQATSNFERVAAVPQAVLRTYYNGAHVFVLPTIQDGFPMVLVQAMACGLPVITTPNGSGPDLIEDGVNGFIVPVRSPEAIAEKLEWLYENPEKCFAMGRSARETVEGGYSWDSYGDRSVRMYSGLLSAK